MPFVKGFKTKNVFSANSVDALARMAVSLFMYGSQAILPIPDIDRTRLLYIIGANPAVSQGSVMTAPDCRKRLMQIRRNGAKIVVIDPRRTETAAIADMHYFIRPGTDALFLLAVLNVLFKRNLTRLDRLNIPINGLEALAHLAKPFTPQRVTDAVGIKAQDITLLACQFAQAQTAVCYGRMGTSTQEFGSLTTWLIDALNVVTGNIDNPGGAMFTTPAVDLPGLARILHQPGQFGRWHSRVSVMPEFNGEFPSAALAEEIQTPGQGQIKAFVTAGGNPVLSLPNGKRVNKALKNLEFMVSIDIYINETTRHANIVFPPTTPFEHDHYGLLEHLMGIRNSAHYAPSLFHKPQGTLHIWEIMHQLVYHTAHCDGVVSSILAQSKLFAQRILPPQRQLDLLLRIGPHRLSLSKLMKHPHGIDLGPLEPRLRRIINTPDRSVQLAPEILVKDLHRLEKKLQSYSSGCIYTEFLLVTRRTLRSMNTWMHNSQRLVKGRDQCTLMMHPHDAVAKGFEDGQEVKVTSRTGNIQLPLKITDEMMPGVVSMPFGWGHDRKGVRLEVARKVTGVSMNDITDETLFDKVCGIAVLDGIPVKIDHGSPGITSTRKHTLSHRDTIKANVNKICDA